MPDTKRSDITFNFSAVMPEFLTFFDLGHDHFDKSTISAFKYAPSKMYPTIFKMRDLLTRLGESSISSFTEFNEKFAVISELVSESIGINSIITDPISRFHDSLFEAEFSDCDTSAISSAKEFLSLCKRSVTLNGDGILTRSLLKGALLMDEPPHISLICKRPIDESLSDGVYNVWKNGCPLTFISEYGLDRVKSRLRFPYSFTSALSHTMIPGRSHLTSLTLDVSDVTDDPNSMNRLVEDTVYKEISARFRRSSKGNLFYKKTELSDGMLVSGMFCHLSDDGKCNPLSTPMSEGGAVYDILTLTPHNYHSSDTLNRIGKSLVSACRFLDESIPLTVMPRIVDIRHVSDDSSLLSAVENHCKMMPMSYSGGAVLSIVLDGNKYFPKSYVLRRVLSAFLADGGFMITFSSGECHE